MTAGLDRLNSLLTGAFDYALRPLVPLGPLISLAVVSCLTACATVWVVGRFSDQGGIRRVKSQIQAGLLALGLYRSAPDVLPRILRALFLQTLAYLRLSLPSLLVVTVPLLAVFVQLDARFSHRPLRVGEPALVSLGFRDAGLLARPGEIRLDSGPGVTVETPAVRIPSLRRTIWRVRAVRDGKHPPNLSGSGFAVTGQVVVGRPGAALATSKKPEGNVGKLLQQGAPPLARHGGGIGAVAVAYPELWLSLLGVRFGWLTWFLLVALISAWAAKTALRVSL